MPLEVRVSDSARLRHGPWAGPVAAHARAGGSTIIAITPGCDAPDWADEAITGQADRHHGRDRVQAVRACTKLQWTETACDGVILAASPRPNRNITGALADDSPGVTFIQALAAASVIERSEVGRRAARSWIAANTGAS